jgi:DNA-binding MarR family transcriptional regulator
VVRGVAHETYRNAIYLEARVSDRTAGGRRTGRARTVTQTEYEALAEFRRALRAFLSFSEAAAERVGLTPRQHQALLAIRGNPGGAPLGVGALAADLQVRHHSAVGLVDRLSRAGLVVRHHATGDRRQVLVSLTSAGERLLGRLSSVHRDELRQLGPRLRALLEAVEHGDGP